MEELLTELLKRKIDIAIITETKKKNECYLNGLN